LTLDLHLALQRRIRVRLRAGRRQASAQMRGSLPCGSCRSEPV